MNTDESRLPTEIVKVLTGHGLTLDRVMGELIRREYWEGQVIEAVFYIVEGDDPESSGAKLALVTKNEEIVAVDVPAAELPSPQELSDLLDKNGERG